MSGANLEPRTVLYQLILTRFVISPAPKTTLVPPPPPPSPELLPSLPPSLPPPPLSLRAGAFAETKRAPAALLAAPCDRPLPQKTFHRGVASVRKSVGGGVACDRAGQNGRASARRRRSTALRNEVRRSKRIGRSANACSLDTCSLGSATGNCCCCYCSSYDGVYGCYYCWYCDGGSSFSARGIVTVA